MKTITRLLLTTLLAFSLAEASDSLDSELENRTCLYLISSPGDWVGNGKYQILDEYDGKFGARGTRNSIQIHFGSPPSHSNSIWYHIDLKAPNGQSIEPGIYKKAHRCAFSDYDEPGLDIGGCGAGCNVLIGNFEIFDIQFDEKNTLVSLAGNLFQCCEGPKAPPLFAAIRYNSNVPVRANVNEIFGQYSKVKSCLYLVETHGRDQRRHFLTDKNYTFEYAESSDFWPMFIAEIKTKELESTYNTLTDYEEEDDPFGFWRMFSPEFKDVEPKFAYNSFTEYDEENTSSDLELNSESHVSKVKLELCTEKEIGFAPGLKEMFTQEDMEDERNRSLYDHCLIMNIDIDGTTYHLGEYKVIDIVRDSFGEIKSLAINILLKTGDHTSDSIVEGCLRFNSDVHFDLDHPYLD